ncbi:MAG: acyl-CoA dehydrogenase, partial [Comamonadaceae bacterium]
FLPRTLSGEIAWAQGYSEPEAGSDLFNVRTRAVREGHSWIINGQKIWQTAGLSANWLFALVRTDPALPGGKGLSFILLPIDQPGVTVRGIKNMAGETEFAEVFLTDAVASDEHVVGGVGNGAQVALGLLGFERGAGGLAAAAAARIEVERLIELARATGGARDRGLRRRIARCRADVHVLRCLALRSLSAGVSGDPPGPESSVTKMFMSLYRQRVTELALDLLGRSAVSLDGPSAVAALGPQPRGLDAASATAWVQDALHARPGTVYGGSLQIQRNTLAERVLGLPREPRQLPVHKEPRQEERNAV